MLHGSLSAVLQDEMGQILEAHSISAGLDYPGSGPEHAHLRDIGRARYLAVTDAEALATFRRVTRLEGIIPALETAHALHYALQPADSGARHRVLLGPRRQGPGRGPRAGIPAGTHEGRGASVRGDPVGPSAGLIAGAQAIAAAFAGDGRARGADALHDGRLPRHGDLAASRRRPTPTPAPTSSSSASRSATRWPTARSSTPRGRRALRAGATTHEVLAVGRTLAERVPVVAMVYANLVLARGLERFADDLAAHGISGLIVPDLPLEESDGVRAACDAAGIALVPLVAPTTPDERMARIGASARGFVYAVSVAGTTGERAALADVFAGIVARAKASTACRSPLGFGIGTPEQAREAADAGADGVIVGSRLVRAVAEAEDPAAAVHELVARFAQALR